MSEVDAMVGDAQDRGAITPRGSYRSGRMSHRSSRTPVALDVDQLLDDRHTRIVVCCGAGGVGKTTTAAALGLRAAERGRRVVVLTIDPARRLAQALGLHELDNTPRAVAGVRADAGGSLDAMMLDMKRTFDDVVHAHASPHKAAQILANPFYEALSSSFAGTQEYMAMEKLGQLHECRGPTGAPRWDLIVVDTPPSRSALDFLDAPERLGSFLDGRFIRLLTAPAKVGGRAYVKVVQASMAVAGGALTRLLGAQMLADVQTLVAALDTIFGGFRERATLTYALLQDARTAFLVVSTPERDALREAGFFVDRLAADDMPLAGAIINRVTTTSSPLAAEVADRAADRLATDGGDEVALAVALLRVHAVAEAAATRQQCTARRWCDAHPEVPVVHVPAGDTDVHDLAGLRLIGRHLAGAARPSGTSE